MKPIFTIILTALIILVAFQVYALVSPDSDAPDTQLSLNNPKTDQPQPKPRTDQATPVPLKNIIEEVTRRNLFKVDVSADNNKAPEPENLHLEKTSLKLTLWGTVTGETKQEGWAVIEDHEKKQQDLYRVQDKIQGATIKSILRNKIILTVNGKDQVLEVNDDSINPKNRKHRPPAKHPKRPRTNAPPPDPEKMKNTASQSNQLFKTRPYYKNGEASGVMVYSIRSNSVARRMGLRNGDIIQAVGGDEIQDPQDLEDLGESIDDYSDISISILRRGKSKEIIFSAEDNKYSINDVEQ